MSTLTEISKSMQGMLYSGPRLFTAQINALEQISGGQYQIVDPTNPMVNLLEMSASIGAALKIDREISLRKQYPSLAQTYEDLYHHMSDEDYLGRFAMPAITPHNFLIRKEELLTKAVATSDADGAIRKLVIPKYTTVSVAGVTHTLSYPIELRVLTHGGIQIVYDTTEQNPLQLLESNIIDYSIIKNAQIPESIVLTVPLAQYVKDTYFDTLNQSTGFRKAYTFSNRFYYCRVYGVVGTAGNETYREFATTHSEQVYDNRIPTALLRVTDGELTVEIPQIYFNRGLLPSKIRVDIFTTNGVMNMDLSEYGVNSFATEWGDGLETAAASLFIAPIRTMGTAGAWSAATIQGGSDGKSLETLTEQVINYSSNPKIVITDAQLRSRLQLRGYDIVLAIDNLTRRVFYATRNLPAPIVVATPEDEGVDLQNFTTGAGCSIDTIQISMEEIAALPYVIDNGERLTITPQALYQYQRGIPKLLPPNLIPNPDTLAPDALASTVNSGNYAYSPFYYVLDATSSVFDVRCYHMDNPKTLNRQFVQENSTAGLQISTAGYSVEKTADGYRIVVMTVSDDAFKELLPTQMHAQLSYRPPFETRDAYLNGTILGTTEDGEYVWEFLLDSRLDITKEDQVFLDNFGMFVDDYRSFRANLNEMFNIYYAVSDYEYFGMQNTDIDNVIGAHLLPDETIGITHEKFVLQFGVALKNLWVNGRTVPGSIRYQTYPEDVVRVYEKTELLQDADGKVIFDYIDGEMTYTVLHNKGDPVLVNGEPEYLHRKNDLVYVDGEPVPITDRNTLRLLDVFLIDGAYFYATYGADVNYKVSIPETIVKFINEDLVPLQSSLLQETELYFYPKKTIGNTRMIVGNQIESELPAGLSFTVRHYLTGNVYRDEQRRQAIKTTTNEVINRRLSRTTVSVNDFTDALKEALGEDVLAIDMDKLGPFKDLAAFSAVNDSRRCSVKRILEVQSDGTFRVREDITVDFLLHRA